MKYCLHGHALTEENVTTRNGCKECRRQRDKKRCVPPDGQLPQSYVPGVTWYRNKWKARIAVKKQEITLGFFTDKQDAIAARKDAEARFGVRPLRYNLTTEEKKAEKTAYNSTYYKLHREREIARSKRRRQTHPEIVLKSEQNSARKRQQREPLRQILLKVKRRAEHKNIPFALNLLKQTLPAHCEICGTAMKIPLRGSGRSKDTVSIDRIDPDPIKGYIEGNVKYICSHCNRLKCDCTDSWRFRAIADYIDRNLSPKQ